MNNFYQQKSNVINLDHLLYFFIFYCSIFSAFLNSSLISFGLVFFLLIIYLPYIKFSISDLIIICLLALYLSIVLIFSENFIVSLQNFRFWLGMIFYLLLFKFINPQKFLNINLFRIIIVCVFFEAILINVFIDPSLIYSGAGSENHKFYGFYYRPMSFAGNASLSASVLVVIFSAISAINDNKIKLLDWVLFIIAIMLFNSGISFILLTIFIIYRMLHSKLFSLTYIYYFIFTSLLIFLAIYIFYIYSSPLGTTFYDGTPDYQKVSADYYIKLFLKKIESYIIFFKDVSFIKFMIGNQIEAYSPSTTGDHGWLIMLQTTGILGFITYFLMIFLYKEKNNSLFFTIFLMLFASFHYPAAMTSAGQIILAILLTHNKKKNLWKI